MNKHKYTNRLIKEKSPYLQQHAHNPIDWWPWSEEAFHAAVAADKPIFLSIGYATCHWCHVMEQEVFENAEVGQKMNETFINVKVDREERPDIDSLYMDFAQSMLGGAAGWPLNMVLTPDLHPFYAATYLPLASQYGLVGMEDLIKRIAEIWHSEQRKVVIDQARKVVEIVASHDYCSGIELPHEGHVDQGAEVFFKVIDPVYGGIRGAPKFPTGYHCQFLLNYFLSSQDSRAIFCMERTLEMMWRGGIYDHLGGGFSRYSVDERWMVPHFEKMLYDNAILSETYIRAWQVTKNPLFRDVSEEVFAYLLRDMKHPLGGIMSAEDADTEGLEGLFYTWTLEEIREVLKKEEVIPFCEFYGVTSEGNFNGRNILHRTVSIEEFAKIGEVDPEALEKRFADQRRRLWEAREKRVHPFKDDKILVSSNGLAIHSLAYAGSVLDRPEYVEAACCAAAFVRKEMWRDGRLMRRWCQGEARFHADLDEYAFFIRGLLTLAEVTGNVDWLAWAVEMADFLESHYKVDGGAFYQSDGSDAYMIVRKANFVDGAEPSGNAIHTENLLRLYQIIWDERYLKQAEDCLKTFARNADFNSIGYCYHLIALQRYLDKKAPCCVVALNEEEEHRDELRRLLFGRYLPHRVVVWRKEGDNGLYDLLSYVKHQVPVEGKTTLYICLEGYCKKPITELHEMEQAIDGLR